MKPLQTNAVISRLAHELRDHGSWCGETHLQKAIYLLQAMTHVNIGFEFVLYKHGPFSFDLRDQLTAMRANELLELELQPQPFGPKLRPTILAGQLEAKFPRTLGEFSAQISFIAETVGSKGVSELERLATALFITVGDGALSVMDRAQRLHQLKPHIPVNDAQAAVNEIDVLLSKASKLH